jgi:DNA polymerase-3 subunit gamma/tau
LDYETYFRFTDMLLQGDYMSALIEYDNVLTKGFSGQIFMAGMNQHLRDLMMARGAGISLIEYTGTLLEKYRQQATKCDGAFLFGAISLLTEADAKLRTATSQRLLVELTLMKIAALAQKKNDDLELPAQPDYPLPELGERQPAPATVTPAPQPQPQVAPQPVQAQPVAQPQPQPVVEQPKPQTPVVEKPQPQPTVVEEPKPIVVAEPKPQPQVEPQPQVAEQTQPQPKKKYASALGDSLADMLKRAGVSAEGGEATRVVIDRDSEAKLVQAKEEIISQMCKLRPRLVTAFEQISFKDNRVVLIVPTKVFEEELYAAKEDILANVASIAKVEGQLEMEVILREVKLDLTPLKFEDRIAHIRKVAPQFDALVKELDLVVDN